MGLLADYSRQALAYDSTRAASPSVLEPLRLALAGAPGRELLDVGGGTGNYALALVEEEWKPVVADRSAQMLAHAAAKGLDTVRADATELPFADESFDAAMLVSMLHHVDAPERALAEARRVLRPGRSCWRSCTERGASPSSTQICATARWRRCSATPSCCSTPSAARRRATSSACSATIRRSCAKAWHAWSASCESAM
jgi:ubiquinone/menaquinone biosynthesis C-methylase UbiE